jgi:hypothetical protein
MSGRRTKPAPPKLIAQLRRVVNFGASCCQKGLLPNEVGCQLQEAARRSTRSTSDLSHWLRRSSSNSGWVGRTASANGCRPSGPASPVSSTTRGDGYSVPRGGEPSLTRSPSPAARPDPGASASTRIPQAASRARVAISGFPLVKPRRAEAAPAPASSGADWSGCGSL